MSSPSKNCILVRTSTCQQTADDASGSYLSLKRVLFLVSTDLYYISYSYLYLYLCTTAYCILERPASISCPFGMQLLVHAVDDSIIGPYDRVISWRYDSPCASWICGSLASSFTAPLIAIKDGFPLLNFPTWS